MRTKINIQDAIRLTASTRPLSVDKMLKKVSTTLSKRRHFATQEAEEKADIMAMRRCWSKWILLSIIAIIVFDFGLIVTTGIGLLNFESGYVVPVVIIESLAKTLGLAIIIVRFLFNSKK